MLTRLSEKVDPKNAVLLVIDMQNDFCHEDGAKAHDGADVEPVQAIVPTLRRLVAGAHEVGLPVIFTQAVHNAWTDSEVRLERHVDSTPNCMEGTWGAEFYGVLPDERDLVIPKARYSAFIGTNLDLVLRAKSAKSLILTGTATGACVESTARDGFMMDYYVVVAADCCAQGNAERHDASLRAMGSVGVVVTSGDILEAWAARA